MRRFAAVATLVLALTPALAFAQTADVMSQIQALLAQITALQGQIQSFQAGTTTSAVTTTPPTTAPASSAATCPALTRTLVRGLSGQDVISLQNFLVAQGYLSSDSSTGFYGALTEAAVQKFQTDNNIVSAGTAATTGFGSVGARTRTLLQQHCTPTVVVQNCPFAPLPTASACAGTWSAITDTNGCTHAWQCTVPLPGPAAVLNCSDINLVCPTGSHPQATTGCSQSCVLNASTATSCPVYSPPLCSSTQQLVGGLYNSSTGCYAAPQCVQSTAVTFTASPTSGTAALSVSFQAHFATNPLDTASHSVGIDFGDGILGSTAVPVDCMNSSCSSGYNYFGTHTYSASGTYTAKVILYSGCTADQRAGGCTGVGAQISSYLGPATTISVSASQSNYISAGPTSGPSPLTVRFSMLPPNPTTFGYTLDLGDGQTAGDSACAAGATSCPSQYDHTYTAGTYTARYKDPSGAVLGSIPITVQ